MIEIGDKIGEGGEAEVFALGDDRVLRRFRTRDALAPERLALTREVADACRELPFATPEVLDCFIDEAGFPCLVERLLAGRPLDAVVADGRPVGEPLLTSYLEVAAAIGDAEFRRPWFGQLIAPDPVRCSTWADYLHTAVDRNVAAVAASTYPDLPPLSDLADDMHRRIDATDFGDVEPRLVHFDYCGQNVLCTGDDVTAVLDWSVLSIAGDPRLDLALSVAFLDVAPRVSESDQATARVWLDDRIGAALADLYIRWGALWWVAGHDDPRLRAWVVRTLTD